MSKVKIIAEILLLLLFVSLLTAMPVYADEPEADQTEANDEPADNYPNGWVQGAEGYYYYVDNVAATGWQQIEGTWYLFGEGGLMLTGWQMPASAWYYLSDSGEMTLGWKVIDGNRYYFSPSGSLALYWIPLEEGWYYGGSDGVIVTGWQKIEGSWYYFRDDGLMATGWLYDGNTWYYLDVDGRMVVGWLRSGSVWYYLSSSGAMINGWHRIGSYWYFFDNSGAMVTGWARSGGNWYFMSESGAMQTGWLKRGSTWYYLRDSGAMSAGWEKTGGNWYYFNSSGAMQTGWVYNGTHWYYMNSSGAMQTGWLRLAGTWYYLKSSGAMTTGWKKIGSSWYFFDGSGAWKRSDVHIAICGKYTSEAYQADDDIWDLMEDLGAIVTKVNSSVNVSEYDGLLVPGGIDVTPSLYGEKDTNCETTDLNFDNEQLKIIDKFVKAGKPVLGICRGFQLLNVYFGGSLIQDIKGHRNTTHTVNSLSGSLLNDVCGTGFSASSQHHQAIKTLADCLTATQWSPDKIIEGAEHNSLPVVGVMWHPEWSGSKGTDLVDYFLYTMCRAENGD